MEKTKAMNIFNTLATKINGIAPFTIEFNEINKNNTQYFGIVIKTGTNCCPNLYITDNVSISDLEKSIYKLYEENKNLSFNIDSITKENVLANVIPCIVSNTNTKMLEDKVVIPYLDFSIYFRYLINDEMTFIISNGLMEMYHISIKELQYSAFKNIEDNFIINDFSSILGFEVGTFPLYILRNRECRFGANCILNTKALDKALSYLNSDSIYILPSSVHETLILDKNMENADFLLELVKTVNETEVSSEDILTNSVYQYSLENGLEKIA